MPQAQPAVRSGMPARESVKRGHRSRKGCPECRARKIKCDEKRPECTQCVKSRRSCRIIDGLFRPHELSIPTQSVSRTLRSPKPSPSQARSDQDNAATMPAPPPTNPTGDVNCATNGPRSPVSPENEIPVALPAQSRGAIPIGGLLAQSSPSGTFRKAVEMPSVRSLPTANLYLSTSPIATHGHPTVASHASSQSSAIPASLPEENNQDSAEVGFFLRHFAEHGGQWMDICTGQRSYFSQYVVQLASQSPILRYSACAFAAKQMGQMKDSTRATNITTRSSMTASMLLRASLDFLWYGAKYYEKAILLMARQISHDRSTVQNHLSPGEIYRSPGSDYHHLDYHESTSSAFRILAACILCSYEDLSGTMRAWTGHLDGINKLFRPHLDLPISPDNFYRIPQSMRALNVSFWYFALNDMLNGFTLSQPCRINPDDHPLWRKMGLPLSDSGQLMSEYIEEEQQESIFFKALIRLLCKLVNLDKFNNPRQWTLVDTEFTQWRNALPPEFFAPITHNLPPTQPPTQEPPAETWLSSETCAVAMAFYHMARIVLIINQPQEIFITAQKKPGDLLSTYKVLHENLTHHANEILPIAHGMPNITVQKYLVQPLYVSARCFLGWNERITVIELLRNIQASLGLATEYRVKDLAEEWKIDYESISLPEHGVNVVP